MTLEKYSFNGIEIYHNLDEHPDQRNFSMHTHNTAEIVYFISGNGIFHVEGTSYHAHSGNLLIMKPLEFHYFEITESAPYERIVIYYNPDIYKNIDNTEGMLEPLYSRKYGQNNLYKNNRQTEYIHQIMVHMLQRAKEQPIVLYSDLLTILIEINEVFKKNSLSFTHTEKTLEYNIVKYINAHLGENIMLDDLCKKYFISKTHLNRIFKTATGTTVKNYINIKRLKKIKMAIENGAKPTEAYLLYGFEEYSTFYRAYVKQFGISPKTTAVRSKQ